MIADAPGGSVLDVKVIPRAGKSGLAGTRNAALLVRLAAAPVDGAANAELLALLARTLDIPRRQLQIVAGDKARLKRIKIAGLGAAAVRQRLGLDG